MPLADRAPGSRTGRDRLEILHALMAAPTFDPAFREDIIRVPRDHPVYSWRCHVPHCEPPAELDRLLCKNHYLKWLKTHKSRGIGRAEFARRAKPLKSRCRSDRDMCRICPDLPAWSTMHGLCFLHAQRWWDHCRSRNQGHSADIEAWVSTQIPLPVRPVPGPRLPLLGGTSVSALRSPPQRATSGPGGRADRACPPAGAAGLLSRGKPVPVQYATSGTLSSLVRGSGSRSAEWTATWRLAVFARW